MKNYPSLILKSGRERSLLNRHPWVYSGALSHAPKNLENGCIVSIVDNKGQMLGLGHYVQDASIACRLFHFGNANIVIDDNFWKTRFKAALQYRKNIGFQLTDQSEGFRLFYSEADGLPGLICDVFGNTASLQIKTPGMLKLKNLIVDFLKTELNLKNIYQKSEDETESGWLLGKHLNVSFKEENLVFPVEIESGQKTGYFLDQRDNRKLVGSFAKNKTVLDTFCYSGGFSLFALANNADHVTSIDISKQAIELCRKTVAANFNNKINHEALVDDCFEYLRNMPKDHFDLIVLDPPAFAKSAATMEKAARGYKDINLLALKNIKSEGILFTFSCSQHISADLFRKIVFGAAKDSNREVRIMQQLHQAPDHPVNIYHPEGEYLKGLMLYVA